MISYDMVYDTLTTAQTSPKLFVLISHCLSLPFQLFYRSSLVRLLKVPGLSQSRKQKSSATLELICKPPILTYTREIHFGEIFAIHFLFCAREGAPVSRLLYSRNLLYIQDLPKPLLAALEICPSVSPYPKLRAILH